MKPTPKHRLTVIAACSLEAWQLAARSGAFKTDEHDMRELHFECGSSTSAFQLYEVVFPIHKW
jgi:hypothetical protein